MTGMWNVIPHMTIHKTNLNHMLSLQSLCLCGELVDCERADGGKGLELLAMLIYLSMTLSLLS